MRQAKGMTHPRGRAPGRKPAGGFTLIEVITVLIVLGVVSVLIANRVKYTDPGPAARLSELRSQLRYVQLEAMKTGQALGLACDGTNYWAYTVSNSTSGSYSKLLLPGESSPTVKLSAKDMGAGAFNHSFDANGIPYSGAPPTPAKLAASTTVTVTVRGASATLTLIPETGFIQ